ncbi:ABC transporter substrate-binding protein, partial [bacterium]|nr:ABC transporter substrate-binding protein [bacterium]
AVALDKYTVEVHLTAPFSGFLNGIASRAALIFSKAYLDKVGVAGYLKAPIGTGPYKIASVSSDLFKLEAFPDYWAGPAKIKSVEIRIRTDQSTQLIALESGDVDFVLSPSIASGSKLNKSRGVVFETGDSAGRVAMLMNDNPGYPGKDKNFRKAVQAGINKKDIILGATEGLATQLDIDMCDSYSGRPSGFNVVKYDAQKAKEYLKASGYKGEPFEMIVQTGTINEPVAQILQAQLMEIGINATVKALDTARQPPIPEIEGNIRSRHERARRARRGEESHLPQVRQHRHGRSVSDPDLRRRQHGGVQEHPPGHQDSPPQPVVLLRLVL